MPNKLPHISYLVATDVGGTCTDTVVFGSDGVIHIGKAGGQVIWINHANIATASGSDWSGFFDRFVAANVQQFGDVLAVDEILALLT